METMSVHEFIKTVSTPEGLLLVLIGSIVRVLIIVPPIVRILRRTGYSGWWAIIGLMPPWSPRQLGDIMCVVGLWVFAYANWPALKQREKFDTSIAQPALKPTRV
jgi:hypothetical protein